MADLPVSPSTADPPVEPTPSHLGLDKSLEASSANQEHQVRRWFWRRLFGAVVMATGLLQGCGVFWFGLTRFDDFYLLVVPEVVVVPPLADPVPYVAPLALQVTFVAAHALLVLSGLLFAYWLGYLGSKLLGSKADDPAVMPHETALKESTKMLAELAKVIGAAKG